MVETRGEWQQHARPVLRFRNAAFYLQSVFMYFTVFLILGTGNKCPV
jgi:hypothetical protein